MYYENAPIVLVRDCLVVSFHYVFITKVDRAYKIICSYNQDSLAIVTHNLNVRWASVAIPIWLTFILYVAKQHLANTATMKVGDQIAFLNFNFF